MINEKKIRTWYITEKREGIYDLGAKSNGDSFIRIVVICNVKRKKYGVIII